MSRNFTHAELDEHKQASYKFGFEKGYEAAVAGLPCNPGMNVTPNAGPDEPSSRQARSVAATPALPARQAGSISWGDIAAELNAQMGVQPSPREAAINV